MILCPEPLFEYEACYVELGTVFSIGTTVILPKRLELLVEWASLTSPVLGLVSTVSVNTDNESALGAIPRLLAMIQSMRTCARRTERRCFRLPPHPPPSSPLGMHTLHIPD